MVLDAPSNTRTAVSKVASVRSTDSGVTFNETSTSAVNCSVLNPDGSVPCSVPDQPQVIADRRTQSLAGGDNLYLAWRAFTPVFVPPTTPGGMPTVTSGFDGVGINCSSDGGDTWKTSPDLSLGAASDFPRIAVGPDGSLWVSYTTATSYLCHGNGDPCAMDADCCSGSCAPSGTCQTPGGGTTSYSTRYRNARWVQKFSSCDGGMVAQPGFPVLIVDGVPDQTEMPGLDRPPVCGPYMVIPDDNDTTGQRLFFSWVEETSIDPSLIGANGNPALANDSLRIGESINGGLTWKIVGSPLNTVTTGHRFLPWGCATNGIAYVTWYDRRDATLTNPDLTAYYFRSAADPTNSGTPSLGAEVNVSGGTTPGTAFDDPQCQTRFNNGIDNADAETLCADLPPPPARVNAGSCQCPTGSATCTMSSGAACDLRVGAAPCAVASEVCVATGGGLPKYGDYNGAACSGGQLFMSWASAVAPAGAACAVRGSACSPTLPCCNGAPCNGGVCSLSSTTTCGANGTACMSDSNCCGNCVGNVCQPPINVWQSSTAVTLALSCATMATPDSNVVGAFDVDTGLPPSTVGAGYGQPSCRNQYLVDVDLTAAAFQGHARLTVSGFWSSTAPQQPCDDLQATTNVFVLDSTNTWKSFDVVTYLGLPVGAVCIPQAQSHTDPGSVGLDVTNIPLTSGFTRARIAVNAVEIGTTQAIATVGQIF